MAGQSMPDLVWPSQQLWLWTSLIMVT